MAIFERYPPAIALSTGRSISIFGVTIVCVIVSTIAVLLRIYARHLKRKAFLLEDYLVFAALVLCTRGMYS